MNGLIFPKLYFDDDWDKLSKENRSNSTRPDLNGGSRRMEVFTCSTH